MGGRGSASVTGSAKNASKSSKSGGGSKSSIATANTKFSTKQITSMNRKQLETAAKAVFVKMNMKRGLSESEALHRANSLMSSNSDAQLRKYIKKYG